MIIRKIFQFFLSYSLSFFLLISISYGATQGSLGTTSNGSANIDISLGDAVRITDIGDAAFGTWDGSGNEANNDDLCVYSNTAGGTYSITATGDGGVTNDQFILEDLSGNELAYQFRWNDVSGTNAGGVNLTSGVILATQVGADDVSTDCSGASALTSRIRIRFLEATLMSAVGGGNYTGNVTISVAPE